MQPQVWERSLDLSACLLSVSALQAHAQSKPGLGSKRKWNKGACAFYQNQTNCDYKHSVASEIAGFFEDQCLFFNVSILKKKKNWTKFSFSQDEEGAEGERV